MEIRRSVAFFISPKGQILFVKTNHIAAVIENPHQFGLTLAEIKSKYTDHGERLGTEGIARREILIQLVSQGWIRLRRYPNQYWSITLNCFSGDTCTRLQNWAKIVLSGTYEIHETDHYMPIRITQLDGAVIENYIISDLASM